VGWWVDGYYIVGGSETKKPKKEICRRVGGLVGSCVGGLVGEMPERNWYWVHTGFFSRQNQLLFFEMEWKRATLTRSTTNVQYSI
jgi:hypothetical protein